MGDCHSTRGPFPPTQLQLCSGQKSVKKCELKKKKKSVSFLLGEINLAPGIQALGKMMGRGGPGVKF